MPAESEPSAGAHSVRRRRVAGRKLVLVGLAVVLLAGCRSAAERSPRAARSGPIVLITLDALRADAVTGLGGDPGLTPHLAALKGQVDWAGTAVAASSWEVPAMAALFTGLQPWQHQALLETQARLPWDALTLPEALRAAGYQTSGFTSGEWYTSENGYARGFDAFQETGKGWEAAEALSSLSGGRQFLWIHIPEPQAPYVRRAWLLPNLDGGAVTSRDLPRLPRTIESLQLDASGGPAVPLSAADRRLFWAMYRLNVAWADERVGRFLDALRASGQWERTLLVVTASHGEEFGEHGGIQHGGGLGRELVEVPLFVKYPGGWPLKLAVPAAARVAANRLWATLVEAAGGDAAPALAPSLFRAAPPEIVSELYRRNGTNLFSLLSGDEQLQWESRFAPPDPEFSRARIALAEDSTDATLRSPPQAVVARVTTAFLSTLPFAGRAAPRLSLERWAAHGSVPLDDPRRAAALARRLATLWERAAGEERTPAAEARLRMPAAR
jgi:arylsulfatase A-like enzyme